MLLKPINCLILSFKGHCEAVILFFRQSIQQFWDRVKNRFTIYNLKLHYIAALISGKSSVWVFLSQIPPNSRTKHCIVYTALQKLTVNHWKKKNAWMWEHFLLVLCHRYGFSHARTWPSHLLQAGVVWNGDTTAGDTCRQHNVTYSPTSSKLSLLFLHKKYGFRHVCLYLLSRTFHFPSNSKQQRESCVPALRGILHVDGVFFLVFLGSDAVCWSIYSQSAVCSRNSFPPLVVRLS